MDMNCELFRFLREHNTTRSDRSINNACIALKKSGINTISELVHFLRDRSAIRGIGIYRIILFFHACHDAGFDTSPYRPHIFSEEEIMERERQEKWEKEEFYIFLHEMTHKYPSVDLRRIYKRLRTETDIKSIEELASYFRAESDASLLLSINGLGEASIRFLKYSCRKHEESMALALKNVWREKNEGVEGR